MKEDLQEIKDIFIQFKDDYKLAYGLFGLNQMAKIINENNRAKGFWDGETNIGEKLMLIVTEVAEAMEAWRKGREVEVSKLRVVDKNPDYSQDGNFKNYIKDTFEDEIADVFIRLFDLSGALGIDIESHIKHKLEFNKTREKLHGKKC